MAQILQRLCRRKQLLGEDLTRTDLARCLTTLDLTALGVGSTLGAGAYVIAGQVAKTTAGPAVVLSFLIAAVASILAGLCYAEFGARVPKAGSAYVYTYVAVGEVLAFVIGWNLILEYVIGAASVARTFSGYFDDLIGDRAIPFFNRTFPMHIPTFAPYFDLLAFSITLLVTAILILGVKESATFTKVFTALNMVVLSYIIICGFFKDDWHNWNLEKSEVPDLATSHCASKPASQLLSGCCNNRKGCGEGGFAPYGFTGVIQGAATCFFAFVGFDAIATTGEETKNPQRSIPLAIIASLLIVFVMYVGVSLTLTLMSPYYLLDMQAPFSKVFARAGWKFAKYVVSVGAMCALCTSLLGAMFPMPRIVLAMARDGLLFRYFSRVNDRLKTPIPATLISGTLAAVMAALFDISSLVEMMSIGTLLAYTLVSACVLLLRYDASREDYTLLANRIVAKRYAAKGYKSEGKSLMSELAEVDSSKSSTTKSKLTNIFRPASHATAFSSGAVTWLTVVLSVSLIGLGCMLTYAPKLLFGCGMQLWAQSLTILLLFIIVVSVVMIAIQPPSADHLHFRVPFVPVFPALSMFFNIYLMLNLQALTWLRFGVWMIIGFLIYFGYGIWHSAERTRTGIQRSISSNSIQSSVSSQENYAGM